MNPFDKQELIVLDKITKDNMPHHKSNGGLEIKRSFSQGLPKNVKDYSIEINNKFLNNYLSIFEEMEYRKPKNKISNMFRNYQNKIYNESGILNHDNFFHADLATGTPISNDNFKHYPFLIDSYRFPVPAVDGDELEFDAGGSNAHANGKNVLMIEREVGIVCVPTQLYDQIALNFRIATGNTVLGVYDSDGSNDAENLLGTTGSFSTAVNYDYHSMSEFAMTTEIYFIANLCSDDGTGSYGNTSATNSRQYKAYAFGALADPAGSIGGYSTDDYICETSKVSHS